MLNLMYSKFNCMLTGDLVLRRVELDRTDFNGEFKRKSYSSDQRLSPDATFSRTFLRPTYNPYRYVFGYHTQRYRPKIG